MRKIIAFGVLLAFILFLPACGRSNHSEAVENRTETPDIVDAQLPPLTPSPYSYEVDDERTHATLDWRHGLSLEYSVAWRYSDDGNLYIFPQGQPYRATWYDRTVFMIISEPLIPQHAHGTVIDPDEWLELYMNDEYMNVTFIDGVQAFYRERIYYQTNRTMHPYARSAMYNFIHGDRLFSIIIKSGDGCLDEWVAMEDILKSIRLTPTDTPTSLETIQPITNNDNEIAACTDEQYINEYYFEAIVDFLVVNYPQIFMRTLVSEDTDGGRAGFRHGSWRIFDFYRDRPVIAVTFHDAGSWTGPAYYFFVDGKYRRVRDLPPALSRLIPTRSLGDGFHEQITEAVNQRLWPLLTLRAGGLIVDGNLSDALVDNVINFVMGLQHVQTIDVIKASLIQDDLISVAVTCIDGFRRYHWVLLDKVDGVYDVYSHCDEYLWWGNG